MKTIVLNALLAVLISFAACNYETCYECTGPFGKHECCGDKKKCETFLRSCEAKGGKVTFGKTAEEEHEERLEEKKEEMEKKVDEVEQDIDDRFTKPDSTKRKRLFKRSQQ